VPILIPFQSLTPTRLILTYLVPCHLLTTQQLPTRALLAQFPRLSSLFLPLADAIKRGHLADFDAALAAGEGYFVKRRIYLTLERSRDIALRNLLRKVFLAGGHEPLKEGQTEESHVRRTRVPIDEFVAAVKFSSAGNGEIVDRDEVECLLGNMIYKVCTQSFFRQAAGPRLEETPRMSRGESGFCLLPSR
jgi:hypothetical protein